MLFHVRHSLRRWPEQLAWRTLFAGLLVVTALAGGAGQFYGYPRKMAETGWDSVRTFPVQGRAWLQSPRMHTLHLDVKFKHLLTLEEKRKQALIDDILLTSGDDFVPAQVRLGHRSIPAKIRLKGDWTDHLRGKKWSYRIKVRGTDHLWGMRTFSIQHPSTRNWDGEWLYHKHLRQEGVLALRYGFLRVRLNGDSLGIYALEEHFSKELLESQQRRQGVIIKPDEDGMWARRVATRKFHSLRYEDLRTMPLAAFQETKVQASPSLSAGRDAALLRCRAVLEGRMKASDAFNVDTLARHLAVSELWGARHALSFHNFRLYYNPIDSSLEPIGFDANPLLKVETQLLAPDSQWTARLLEDPLVADAYVRQLRRMTRPEYMNRLRSTWEPEWQEVITSFQTEWPDFKPDVWDRLEKRRKTLERLLVSRPPIQGSFQEVDTQQGAQVKFDFQNTTSLPVRVTGVRVNGQRTGSIDAASLLLPRQWPYPANDRVTGHERLRQPIGSVEVICRAAGEGETVVVLRRTSTLPNQNEVTSRNIEQVVQRYGFLRADASSRSLIVQPGSWEIGEDLVVPDKWTLKISGDTTLRFARDAMLVAGRTEFRGTRRAPICLVPQADRWKGVALRGPALWQNVRVSGASAGVTGTRAYIQLSQCRFEQGVDGFRIQDGQFQIDATEFRSLGPYALQTERSTGHLTDCTFSRIEGDALALRNSTVHLDSIVIQDAQTGLSVSDRSSLNADHVFVQRASRGVDCVALSVANCNDLYLETVTTGLSARTVSAELGDSTIEVVRYNVRDVKHRFVRDPRCRILIDAKHVP